MRTRAFTLVEILIVVIILGILAAIVVPQYSKATEDSKITAAKDQLEKVRRALGVYYVRENGMWPNVTAGDGTWGGMISNSYMRTPPVNPYVGSAAAKVVILRNSPDNAYQSTHGWVFDPATGRVWAGSFDGNDEPIQ